MKKYHVATGDGKGYYGIGYESYREAVELLKISQSHDPQAHIVEEEYHFTNADRIRAMTDEELVKHFWEVMPDDKFCTGVCNEQRDCDMCRLAWLQQPAEGDA